jgi:hypothetical protein
VVGGGWRHCLPVGSSAWPGKEGRVAFTGEKTARGFGRKNKNKN